MELYHDKRVVGRQTPLLTQFYMSNWAVELAISLPTASIRGNPRHKPLEAPGEAWAQVKLPSMQTAKFISFRWGFIIMSGSSGVCRGSQWEQLWVWVGAYNMFPHICLHGVSSDLLEATEIQTYPSSTPRAGAEVSEQRLQVKRDELPIEHAQADRSLNLAGWPVRVSASLCFGTRSSMSMSDHSGCCDLLLGPSKAESQNLLKLPRKVLPSHRGTRALLSVVRRPFLIHTFGIFKIGHRHTHTHYIQ